MSPKPATPLTRLGQLARKCRQLGVLRCRVRYPDGTELELELGDDPAAAPGKPKVTQLSEVARKRKEEERSSAADERRRRAAFAATGFVPPKR